MSRDSVAPSERQQLDSKYCQQFLNFILPELANENQPYFILTIPDLRDAYYCSRLNFASSAVITVCRESSLAFPTFSA